MYQFPLKVFPNHLNAAAQCLFKFLCQNDPELRGKFLDSPESFAGKAMHLALKMFFNLKEVSMHERVPEQMDQLVRKAWMRLPKGGNRSSWSAEDRTRLFGSAEQQRAYGLQSIDILRNYLAKADLSVVPLALEDWVSCEVDGVHLGGCIDRIDKDGERGIAVWDYKTGKLPYADPTEMNGDYSDYQLPIYAVIASHLFPFAETIRVGLVYVKFCKVYQRSWSREELLEVQADVLDSINRLREEKAFPPTVSGLCPWCEYRKICPAHDNVCEQKMEAEEAAW